MPEFPVTINISSNITIFINIIKNKCLMFHNYTKKYHDSQ